MYRPYSTATTTIMATMFIHHSHPIAPFVVHHHGKGMSTVRYEILIPNMISLVATADHHHHHGGLDQLSPTSNEHRISQSEWWTSAR